MSNLNLNSAIPQNCWVGDPIPFYEPVIREHYYNYPIYNNLFIDENKTEKAFRVAQKLVETKLVKSSTVQDFIDLVNTIIEAL